MKKRELTGMKFGKLIVINEAGRSRNSGDVLWLCMCDCGKEKVITGSALALGKSKTCGHCYGNIYQKSDDGAYMKCINTQGRMFIFDEDDFDILKLHKWYFDKQGYAYTQILHKRVTAHRLILNADSKFEVDHINQLKYDNRKCNLRLVTHQHNCVNVGLQRNNTTGVKGVTFDRQTQKYRAYIKVDGKLKHLGRYCKILDASRVYDIAAKYYFGEFAYLNNL